MRYSDRKNSFALNTANRLASRGLVDPSFADVVKVLVMHRQLDCWGQNSYEACWNICCAHTSLLTEDEREEFQEVAFQEVEEVKA